MQLYQSITFRLFRVHKRKASADITSPEEAKLPWVGLIAAVSFNCPRRGGKTTSGHKATRERYLEAETRLTEKLHWLTKVSEHLP